MGVTGKIVSRVSLVLVKLLVCGVSRYDWLVIPSPPAIVATVPPSQWTLLGGVCLVYCDDGVCVSFNPCVSALQDTYLCSVIHKFNMKCREQYCSLQQGGVWSRTFQPGGLCQLLTEVLTENFTSKRPAPTFPLF